VLALAKESVRLVHAFANFPPERLQVPGLPANAEEATRRPSVHVRAPRGKLQNLEGEKVLLQQYVRKVEQAVHGVLAGGTRRWFWQRPSLSPRCSVRPTPIQGWQMS